MLRNRIKSRLLLFRAPLCSCDSNLPLHNVCIPRRVLFNREIPKEFPIKQIRMEPTNRWTFEAPFFYILIVITWLSFIEYSIFENCRKIKIFFLKYLDFSSDLICKFNFHPPFHLRVELSLTIYTLSLLSFGNENE